jgi:nitroreductase
MDAMEAILTTRAMRRYSADPVPDELVMQCLEAAQQAPSGGNVQPQQYVIVRSSEVRNQLAEIYRRAFERYERCLPTPVFRSDSDRATYERTRAASQDLAATIGDVPVHVLFLQPIIPWGFHDDEGPVDIGRLDGSVYPAVQNFCIAARSLGLGTAFTTVIRVYQAEALEAIGANPDRFEIAAHIPLGYPTGNFGRAPRKDVRRSIHLDRYGERPTLD